jgi:hypothetical protein
MATDHKPVEPTHVACDMCMKEVPLSEATVTEATDYFMHFCGLECFEKWKNQGESPKEKAGKPAA